MAELNQAMKETPPLLWNTCTPEHNMTQDMEYQLLQYAPLYRRHKLYHSQRGRTTLRHVQNVNTGSRMFEALQNNPPPPIALLTA